MIRSQKECVCWFKSCGKGCILSPPDSQDAYDSPLQIADLYIHQYNHKNVHQIHIWMWTGHSWDAVQQLQPNCICPTMPGYCLKILDEGEPLWVMWKTMVSDQGRVKQRSENKLLYFCFCCCDTSMHTLLEYNSSPLHFHI